MSLEIPLPGPRLVDMEPIVRGLVGMDQLNSEGSITAAAAGTQAAGTPLTAVLNEVLTVAGANDSVNLPLALAGKVVFVANPSAATLDVYSSLDSPTDEINGTVGTTAYSIATLLHVIFFCPRDGHWYAVLSA